MVKAVAEAKRIIAFREKTIGPEGGNVLGICLSLVNGRNIEGGHRYRCAEMNDTPYNFIVNLKPELGLEDLIRRLV